MPQLTPKQEEAVKLISLGKSYTEVANTVGCSRKTIYNWIHSSQDGGFVVALNQRRLERQHEIENALENVVWEAVDRLKLLTQSANERVAVSAIRLVLDEYKHRKTVGPCSTEEWAELKLSEDLSKFGI